MTIQENINLIITESNYILRLKTTVDGVAPYKVAILPLQKNLSEKAKEYETMQTSAVSAARRGYVDTIIEPEDTRKYVIGAFEMLFTKREDRPGKKHGTV